MNLCDGSVIVNTLNLAHRGASGDYPENTMLAFEKAIEQGCDGFEMDVHLSADGELVVIHDDTLERTTDGAGDVHSHKFADLRKLHSGIHKGVCGQKIPHLREVLDLVQENGLTLNIEIKNDTRYYPKIEEKVIGLVHDYNLADTVFLSSFNHRSMVLCKEIDPSIRAGLLYAMYIPGADRYALQCGVNALHPHYKVLLRDETLPQYCRGAKIALNVWTINEENDMRSLLALGVNSIITNYPERLNRIIEEMSA